MNNDSYLTFLIQAVSSYKSNEFATHQPVLWTYLHETEGPVCELHSVMEAQYYYTYIARKCFFTVDDNPAWLNKFASCASDMHKFILLNRSAHREDASHWKLFLKFVEIVLSHSNGALSLLINHRGSRYHSAEILKNNAQMFFIIHSCDYYPENNKYFGKVIQRLQPYVTEKQLSDMFKYSQSYFRKNRGLRLQDRPPLWVVEQSQISKQYILEKFERSY